MTAERENRWLKVIVVVMFVAGVLSVIGQQHARNALMVAADQQTRLWQLRCSPQNRAADESPVWAAAVSQIDAQDRVRALRDD